MIGATIRSNRGFLGGEFLAGFGHLNSRRWLDLINYYIPSGAQCQQLFSSQRKKVAKISRGNLCAEFELEATL
jgi:hypothetical protein